MSIISKNPMIRYQKMTNYIGNQYEHSKNSVTKAQKWAFFSAITWGIIAHIPAISNDILNHDSIASMNPDSAYNLASQGKWSAGVMVDFLRGVLTTPSWFVLLGILLFAISAFLITRMFSVRSPMIGMLVGAFLVTYDTIASMTLAYGTDYFALCFLLAVFAAYSVRVWRYGWICSVLILGFSLGGYQPVIGATAGLLVLLCVMDCFYSKKRLSKIILNGLKYIAILLAGGAIYYLTLQWLNQSGISKLGNYRNISSISPSSFLDFGNSFRLVRETVKYVYDEIGGKHSEPYMYMKRLFPVFGAVSMIACIASIIHTQSYKNHAKFITGILLLLLVFPLAANVVDFLTLDDYLSRIMRYTFILVFIAPLLLCEGTFCEKSEEEKGNRVSSQHSCSLAKICLFLLSVILVMNWCCLNHDIYGFVVAANRQMFAKATILMSSIYDCDGYTSDSSVVLLGTPYYPFFEDTNSMTAIRKVAAIKYGTQGVYSSHDIFYNSRLLKSCLNSRLGANFTFVDENVYYQENKQLCDELSIYPNDGAVYYDEQNNVIVVKLSESK